MAILGGEWRGREGKPQEEVQTPHHRSRPSPRRSQRVNTNTKTSRHLQTQNNPKKKLFSTLTMSPTPLHERDILFPTASTSIKTTLLDLKRSNLSIHNRLTSIATDGTFVAKVAQAFQLPLIANERCGSWYIDPALKAGSAYFKSTDGHFGEWSFSLRRLNLGVLGVVGGEGG